MTWRPKPQEIYKHFKGKLYQVITLAEHTETGEAMVVYQALYGEYKVYVNSLDVFVSKVDRMKYPDSLQEYRFTLQHPDGLDVADEDINKQEMLEKSIDAEAYAIVDTAGYTKRENAAVISSQNEKTQVEEFSLDPLVWEFLDADSHEKRLNILAALHHRITDDMITTMAVACDVEVPGGDVEERYSQLKNCLLMLDRFEIKRK